LSTRELSFFSKRHAALAPANLNASGAIDLLIACADPRLLIMLVFSINTVVHLQFAPPIDRFFAASSAIGTMVAKVSTTLTNRDEP
jgi:hypothetical protein